MTPSRKPRRHHHLSRESIARAALALVDEEGAEALTVRRLAKSLNVGATNLYTYYPDREGIVLGVVALLLAEVEMPADPDLSWEECLYAIGTSLRAMALRHPRAFTLVAGVDFDEWPLVEYGRKIDRLMLDHGVLAELLPRLASLMDSYATGFLLLETQTLTKVPGETWNPLSDSSSPPPLAAYTVTDSEEAFEEGTRALVAGFKLIHGLK